MSTVCVFDSTNGARLQDQAGTDLPARLELNGTEYGRFDLERTHEGAIERTPVYSTHLPTRAEVEKIYLAVYGDKPGSRAVH